MTKKVLSTSFLDYDILKESEFLDSESPSKVSNYTSMVSRISREIRQANETSRRSLSKISNIILDGDVSDDGSSINKGLSDFQERAYEIMRSLHEDSGLDLLDKKNMNAILAGSVTVIDPTDTYYQSIDYNKEGKLVRTSPYNIILHIDHLFSVLKDSFLIGKAIVDKDLFTFVCTVLCTITDGISMFKLEFDKNFSIVLLYLAKFEPIDEDELLDKINANVLDLSKVDEQYKSITFDKKKLVGIINQLEKIKVIQLLDGKVYLKEKIYL